MNLSIIGAGHVGLVAGACFAEIGHNVVCIDNDAKKIADLEAGRTPFYEPHLPEMLADNVKRGRLRFSLELADAVSHAEVIFLCVGTPPLPGGEADLSAVERVTRQIAMLSDGYRLIVEKSTVPVLTGERIYNTMRIYRASHGRGEFDVASNPEFLAEGTAVRDFLYPDRIVLGVETERAGRLLRELYAPVLERTFCWRPSEGAPSSDKLPSLVATNPQHGGDDQARLQLFPLAQDLVRQHGGRGCAMPSAPTSTTSRAAWASISVSGRSSCAPVSASAASASRRTCRRSSAWPSVTASSLTSCARWRSSTQTSSTTSSRRSNATSGC